MLVTHASVATPGRINDDFVVSGPTWAVVLDGATAQAVDSGCVHDVPWLVRHLAAHFARWLTVDSPKPLPDVLADSIAAVCADHRDTCDLSNPDSPSATVAAFRCHADTFDYVVLGDSSVLIDGESLEHVTDDRTEHLSDYSIAGVRAARNQPGGFWVASTRPEAAYYAVTGSRALDTLTRAALLTDGASRWVDRFGLGTWSDALAVLTDSGPAELIAQVRKAETSETTTDRAGHRGKPHDDATALLARWH